MARPIRVGDTVRLRQNPYYQTMGPDGEDNPYAPGKIGVVVAVDSPVAFPFHMLYEVALTGVDTTPFYDTEIELIKEKK